MTVLRRNQTGDLKPGEYSQVLKHHLHGDTIWCHWVCPTCSTPLSIAKRIHNVTYLGIIKPKVTCPRKCGFEDAVALEDWVPEAVGTA